MQRPHRHVGPQLRRARAVAARAPRPPEPAVHRAAGDPRRLLLGRLLHGRRVPARAHARRGGAVDERDLRSSPARAPATSSSTTASSHHLPLIDLDEVTIGRKVDYWRLWWEHQENDEYWHQFKHQPDKVTVPIFQQGGWFDPYSGSHLRSFAAIGDRVPNRVMIGPWSHEEEVETFRGDVDLLAGADRDPRPRARLLRPLPEGRGQRLGGAAARGALRARRELLVRRERVAAARHGVHAVAPARRRRAEPRRRRRATSRPTATTTTRRTRCRRSAASTRC